MHEIGMLYQAAETVTKFAEENGIDTVREITIEIGEISGVLPDIFTEYFGYVMGQYPRLADARLKMHKVTGEGLCTDCNCLYNIMKNDGICPRCHSTSKKILGGTQINIESIGY